MIRKNVKKEVEEVKEKKEKGRKKISLKIVGVIVIIIVLFSFFLGIKINFILNDELLIQLDPLYISIDAHYSDVPVINFTIENKNFKLCSTFCEYELRDVRTNKVVHYSNKTFESDQTIVKKYSLPLNEIGAGQVVYLFDVVCSNIRTNICSASDMREKNKVSFITINYDISKEEERIKEKINVELSSYLKKLSDSEKIMKENNIRVFFFNKDELLIVPEEVNNAYNINQELEEGFLGLGNSFDLVKGLWDKQDYLRLDVQFNQDLVDSLLDFEEKTKTQSEKIDETISIYNYIVGTSYLLILNKDKLNEINNYYLKMSDSKSKSVISYSNQLQEVLLQLELGKIRKYSQFIVLLDSYKDDFSDLTNIYEFEKEKYKEEFINYTMESLNITFFNESVEYCNKVDHIYCSNQTFDDSINFSFSTPLIKDEIDEEIELDTNSTLTVHKPKCCAFDECYACCEDCGELYPVIFLHGHSLNEANSPETSLASLSKIQKKLMDIGYINAGQMDVGSTLEDVEPGEWGVMPFPLTIRVSYYLISYYDLGSYTVTAQKTDNIENYAIRLKEIIDLIKVKTKRNKVNIIAHSMGGLVAREYMAIFGEQDVNKLIMIGTSNHGIKGNVKKICSLTGASKECKDMSAGSIFLKRLNNRPIPINTKLYTIAAIGCDMDGEDGDGITVADSVPLDYAENFVIKGECTDFFNSDLHTRILDPDLYPKTYEIIKEILNE